MFWGPHSKPVGLKNFRPYQQTTLFPPSWYLGRKDLMFRGIGRMKNMYAKYNYNSMFFARDNNLSSGDQKAMDSFFKDVDLKSFLPQYQVSQAPVNQVGNTL